MGTIAPISVIIPTMNRPETLERTLATYVSGDMVPDQIVIVDQTQDGQIRDKVRNIAQIYRCDYIYLQKPSLTAARNAGLGECEMRYSLCPMTMLKYIKIHLSKSW